MYIAWRLANTSGIEPVNTIANHEMTAITWARIPSAYTTRKCGMASSQCTKGPQLATLSAGSNVNFAGSTTPPDPMPSPPASALRGLYPGLDSLAARRAHTDVEAAVTRASASACTEAMSSATNGPAERRMKPAATRSGTSVIMLAWMPRASETLPIRGRTTTMPGMENIAMLENVADRTRGGDTIASNAKNAGANVPMLAASNAWQANAIATWGA